jgi:hypothetical protein
MENNPKTLKDCFTELIQTRAWYKDSKTDRKAANKDKVKFLQGKLSEKKIKNYLNSTGYKIYQQELWIKK